MKMVTLRTYRRRKKFDYRGMKSRLKSSHVHFHCFKDIWVECKDKEDIRRMYFIKLTTTQITNFDIENSPIGFEDIEDILNIAYDEEVARNTLPPI
jgi:hypothetical protein